MSRVFVSSPFFFFLSKNIDNSYANILSNWSIDIYQLFAHICEKFGLFYYGGE